MLTIESDSGCVRIPKSAAYNRMQTDRFTDKIAAEALYLRPRLLNMNRKGTGIYWIILTVRQAADVLPLAVSFGIQYFYSEKCLP